MAERMLVSNCDEYRKDKEITYERGCVGDQAGEPLALKVAVVKLETRRASMASAQEGQTLTPNIGLFGFCRNLKIRRLPVLGLEFEAESQKWHCIELKLDQNRTFSLNFSLLCLIGKLATLAHHRS